MADRPSDPLARHNRLIAALCEDLASVDYLRTGRTPRADAQCGINRERRKHDADPPAEPNRKSAPARAFMKS